MQAVSQGLFGHGFRLCEQEKIALRLLNGPIAGHNCDCANLQTNPGALRREH
jgi:hypothetical protein